jgi:hypothetical protein
MGTRGGGNGDGWPPDGLPDLPPEWGAIVIPDDASELAEEAARVRRQLRRDTRRRRWRRRLHLPPANPRPDRADDTPTLGVPLLVISIAVIATLTSLFAIAWPTRRIGPELRPSAGTTPPPTAATTSPSTVSPNSPALPDSQATIPHALGDLTLLDATGATLPLRAQLPAVLLLIDDGRDHSDLISATVIASTEVNPAIRTVAVGTTAVPSVGSQPAAITAHLVAAKDPAGVLRAAVPGTGQPSVLLVGPDATLVRIVPTVSTINDFRADLPKLAGH